MNDATSVLQAIQQARMLLSRQRAQEALGVLDRFSSVEDRYPDLLLLRAQALLAAGRLEDAVPAFRGAINAAPDAGIAELGLAVASGQPGDPVSAERAARNAIAKGLDNAGSRFVLARNLFLQGRFDEAEPGFRDVLRMEPDHPGALRNLAEAVWQRTGDAGRALATIEPHTASRSIELALFRARLVGLDGDPDAELAELESALGRAADNIPPRLQPRLCSHLARLGA